MLHQYCYIWCGYAETSKEPFWWNYWLNLISSELLHNAHSILLKQKDKIIEHAAEHENETDQCGNINQAWKELERASALVI
jgi:hypothetical protein